MNPSDKIKQLQRLAKKRGGKCLSLTYKNSVTKLDWQCAKEHQWEALPGNIKQGTWCPACAKLGPSAKKNILDMQNIAGERGGKCLSTNYKGAHSKLLWQCEKEHQWEAYPKSIRQSSWCPKCAGNKRHNIEDMQRIAKDRGGKCLTNKYKNNMTKLLWECSQGHQWEAMPMKIISGSWCRKCSRIKKRS